jgi:hypothetical protein
VTTFSQLTDSTLLYLSGFSNLQDQATYLTTAINTSVTTLAVADASALSRGLIEVDDELMWVDSVDTTGLTATVPPYGRGYRGTAAATHAQGTRVVSSPVFPRQSVKDAINETISSLYPDLYGVGTTSFTFASNQATYPLPAEAQSVIQAQWQVSGYTTEWEWLRRYTVDGNADATTFPTSGTITLRDAIVPGRTVRVVYTKEPTPLANSTDVFTTVTGLPQSCADLVRLGAAYRMVPFLDVPHLSGMSAEADFTANMRPVGGAATLSKWLMQQYQIRLQQEQSKLQDQFPVRVRYTS